MNSSNPSGRQMVTYAPSKSDPICKWRAVSIANAIELVSVLPKSQLSKDAFRDYMEKNWGGFFHTAYQLACQMGLYYEDDNIYIPRFDHNIDEKEANAYLHKWMERYYVPNPYTKRGFIGVPPIHFVYALVDYMETYPTKPNLATAGAALFGGEMGNITSVKSMLNNFAEVLQIDDDNNIHILVNRRGAINVPVKRDDKLAFFEHFN